MCNWSFCSCNDYTFEFLVFISTLLSTLTFLFYWVCDFSAKTLVYRKKLCRDKKISLLVLRVVEFNKLILLISNTFPNYLKNHTLYF